MTEVIRKGSPAEFAGLVIGEKYKIITDGGHGFCIGDIVTFVMDDHGTCPLFSRDSDKYESFVMLHKVEPYIEQEDTKIKVKRVGDVVSVKSLAN